MAKSPVEPGTSVSPAAVVPVRPLDVAIDPVALSVPVTSNVETAAPALAGSAAQAQASTTAAAMLATMARPRVRLAGLIARGVRSSMKLARVVMKRVPRNSARRVRARTHTSGAAAARDWTRGSQGWPTLPHTFGLDLELRGARTQQLRQT